MEKSCFGWKLSGAVWTEPNLNQKNPLRKSKRRNVLNLQKNAIEKLDDYNNWRSRHTKKMVVSNISMTFSRLHEITEAER